MTSEIVIYLLLGFLVIIYLNSNITLSGLNINAQSDSNITIIEHLTKHTKKDKNYKGHPKNFTSHGYNISGKLNGENASLTYRFPLINNDESKFQINLSAINVSSIVNNFGTSTNCFGRRDDNTFELKTTSIDYLKKEMNKDGFYFNSFADYGINYNHVIDISKELTTQIAYFIVQELQNKGRDNYVNRVIATLNFVQFIPYGVPDFDHNKHTYFGLAIPHESLAISYSDCDSKSVLFSGILHHLIPSKNIIMVGCTADGGGHMIVGVSDLPFYGQTVKHTGKNYLLLETTTPIPIEHQPETKYQDISIIPVLQV
jgi:hypothetical protein